ncbi:putative methyltransferase C9orf114 [Limulus polyphemus]|uniref:Methyltransferase C9orf114 n=1 Tax=Limulus polyphemus TaxID=6850 RepID=A0ABM1BHX9_LIMPO|nr:putative methyltransferase C9orf114 [Limulus polyphemus]
MESHGVDSLNNRDIKNEVACHQSGTLISAKNPYISEKNENNVKDWKQWKKEKKELHKKWKQQRMIQKAEKLKQKEEQMKEKEDKEREENLEKEKVGRDYTVSIALPGSILDNAQSPELRTYLAGQIARAATIFNVDEVIIFDEIGMEKMEVSTEGEFTGVKKKGQANLQMARILQYLECPQYLRKHIFPLHPDLQFAGLLNPLDSPHHLRTKDICPFREGIVVNRPAREGKGSFVYVGQKKDVRVDKLIKPGVRVTVKMELDKMNPKRPKGVAVMPCTPRVEGGLYWGYAVRLACSLAAVFTECPYKEGYDLTVGTSERGMSVDEVTLSPFKHMLVVFGGLNGLEACLDSHESLEIDDPKFLFSYYLNTCPNQGSRTIRTEEAILISLAAIRPKILEVQGR